MNIFRLFKKKNFDNFFKLNNIIFNRSISLTNINIQKHEITNNNNQKQQEQSSSSSHSKQQEQSSSHPKQQISLLTSKKIVDSILFLFLSFAAYKIYKRYKNSKKQDELYEIEYLQDTGFKTQLFTTNLGDYVLADFLKKNLNKFKTFNLRDDDVFIISFPKSGTTWIQEIVYLILNNCDFTKAKALNIEERMPFIDYPNPGINAINKHKSPRIIKTHLPKPFLPDDIEKKCKVIYIVRNPKDVTVSYYHFIKMSTQAGYEGGFKNFFKSFVTGVVPYGPWWKHVDDYLSTSNIHIVVYEDLHTKPFETIKTLCKYLGKDVSDDDIKKIIEWCSYKNMKENKSVNYEWYKDYGLFKKDGSFFRKGEIGDWLNYFSKDMSVILDKIVENNLKNKFDFNYGIKNEELIKIYNDHDEIVSKNKIDIK